MQSQIEIPLQPWDAPTQSESDYITAVLGKEPRGQFRIVVKKENGDAIVIENAPFFFDGTPMPTRFWLVDPDIVADVSRVESTGGVKAVQQEISLEECAAIHTAYEEARTSMIPDDFAGPRPSGGVGGTRRGVKCLHTHVANYLATGDDTVGLWTMNKIAEMKDTRK